MIADSSCRGVSRRGPESKGTTGKREALWGGSGGESPRLTPRTQPLLSLTLLDEGTFIHGNQGP